MLPLDNRFGSVFFTRYYWMPNEMILQSRYIRTFERAGAVDEESARTLKDLHLRDTQIFRRMVMRGIFISCQDERYYLNIPVAEVYKTNRQYFLRIFLLVILILLLAFITGTIIK